MKKSVKIILIIIIICVILFCGVAIYAFTDLFKSDKQLFFSYLADNSEMFQTVNLDELQEYGDKKENSPYTSNGTIDLDDDFYLEDLDEEMSDILETATIAITGNTDKASKYSYKKLDIYYNDTENLEIEYANIDDYYGIKMESILKKYIAIENDNLQQLATKLGLSDSVIELIPDKISLGDVSEAEGLFSDSEKKQLKSEYASVLNNCLTKDMFSSTSTDDGETVYTLTMTSDQIKTLINQFLQQLQNDEIVMDKIKQNMIDNSEYTEEEAEEYISTLKETIQNIAAENPTIDVSDFRINIYVENKEMTELEIIADDIQLAITSSENKISFSYKDESESEELVANISKESTSDTFSYNINCVSDGETVLECNINYSGLEALEKVTEKSTLKFIDSDTDEIASYTYTNTNDFTSTFEHSIDTDDLYILNNVSDPSSIVDQFIDTFNELIEEQNENLGVESSPAGNYLPSVAQVAITSAVGSGNTGTAFGTMGASAAGFIAYNMLSSILSYYL